MHFVYFLHAPVVVILVCDILWSDGLWNENCGSILVWGKLTVVKLYNYLKTFSMCQSEDCPKWWFFG